MSEIDETESTEPLGDPAEPEPTTPETTEPEPRQTERERIIANREAALLEEAGERPDEDEDEPEPKPEPRKTIKVKIDGVEEDKTIDELVKNYQKAESGDRRLQQAAAELRRLEEDRQRLQEERQAFEAERTAPPPPPAVPDDDLDQLRLQRKDALEIGDYDEFDRLDEAINSRRGASVVNQEQITQQATKQALNQIQYETALEHFRSVNPKLIEDEVLYNISMSTFNNMCKESTTYVEAFAKTERLMKDWIGSVAQGETSADTAMTDRIDKKKAIRQEPGRLNVKSAPPPAEKEETASEVIANMRRARGLPV
jgi:hypothetical protein